MKRRNLLRATACATAGLIAGLRPAFAADAEIDVSPQAAGPLFSPHIYGHFIEHLGAVIYDDIWVGRDSKIPNLDGIRRQFVDDMKRIGAPNYRWPGGCFADGYHWRDGIGRAPRPRPHFGWAGALRRGRTPRARRPRPRPAPAHLQLLAGPDAARVGPHRDQPVRHSRVHPSVPLDRRRAL